MPSPIRFAARHAAVTLLVVLASSAPGVAAPAPAPAPPAYLRFVHVGASTDFADLVMDDVPLVRAIAGAEASPFIAVVAGWHRFETSRRGDPGSLEVLFGTMRSGRSYDVIRSNAEVSAATLIEEPATGGSLRVVDLREKDAAPVRLGGVGKPISISPGDVIALVPALGVNATLSVADRTGFELTKATLVPHASDHQDLAAIIDGDHGTEIVSFSSRAPIVMAPRMAARVPTASSSIPIWALFAAAGAAVVGGGVAGRRRGRQRRHLAAIAGQAAFRQSLRI